MHNSEINKPELIIQFLSITTKSVALFLTQLPVKLIVPVVAPSGTVAKIKLSKSIVYEDASKPPNFTDVTPVKPEPFIVTIVPTGPVVGMKEEIPIEHGLLPVIIISSILLVPVLATTPLFTETLLVIIHLKNTDG